MYLDVSYVVPVAQDSADGGYLPDLVQTDLDLRLRLQQAVQQRRAMRQLPRAAGPDQLALELEGLQLLRGGSGSARARRSTSSGGGGGSGAESAVRAPGVVSTINKVFQRY